MNNTRPDTWMPMYWGDYVRDTAHLNAARHGAYLMLIQHYWCTGAPLPDDDDVLWRVARCDSKPEWKRMRATIAAFFTVADGVWRHKRIDQESSKATERTSARSQAARAKWGTETAATAARATRSQRLAEAREKGRHTKEEWLALVETCGTKCVRCGASGVELVKDHIKPIYQGGSDGIENIQPLCRTCNASKGPESVDFRPADAGVKTPHGMPAKRLQNALPSQPQSQSHRQKEKVGGGSPPDADFAFVGRVVRLKRADYDRWRAKFHAIPDFDAELEAADAYYSDNPPPKNAWFFPVSGWLNRAHQKIIAERKISAAADRSW